MFLDLEMCIPSHHIARVIDEMIEAIYIYNQGIYFL